MNGGNRGLMSDNYNDNDKSYGNLNSNMLNHLDKENKNEKLCRLISYFLISQGKSAEEMFADIDVD